MTRTAPMTILLALDGSAPSLVARDLAASLPWPSGSTVHLLSAFTTPIDWTGGVASSMDWVGDAEDATRDELLEQLRGLEAPLKEAGLQTQAHAVAQRPASAIIGLAREIAADVILIGSRGHGPLRTMLLGSVATEVAERAHCAVLVARRPVAKSLVVGTDGSEPANAIPGQLAAWGIFENAPAAAVSVVVPDSAVFRVMVGVYTLGDDRLRRMQDQTREHAKQALEEMVRALGAAGLAATAHPREGDPASEILAVATEVDADLVVTGSRGLGGLERMVLGSVARNVLLHAECSVLVMRQPDQE